MTALEIIGAATLTVIAGIAALVAWFIVAETVRATRQACRVARHQLGKGWLCRHWRDAGFPRNFLRQVRHQFCGGEFSIGCVVFPADPSKPFRRRWSD